MAIPEHVRKQAMDAISHKETTASQWLARTNPQSVEAPMFTPKPQPTPANTNRPTPQQNFNLPITPEVGQQAKDVLSAPRKGQQDLFQSVDVRGMIKLVRDNGPVAPMNTPSKEGYRMAQNMKHLHKSGQDVDTVQRQMTKDGFGR